MTDSIDYTKKMEMAMRGLISETMSNVEKNGLPGNHHFFITYDPKFPGTKISDWLLEKYPEEMTVIVQNWFEGLKVYKEYFEITLNFGDSPESLVIYFESIISFVDPSVEFGLKFERNRNTTSQEIVEESEEKNQPEFKDTKVINLDKFRSKDNK